MKILIIGGGTVGRAVARTYLEFHDVAVYDIIPERRTTTLSLVGAIDQADLIFVCLPTPSRSIPLSPHDRDIISLDLSHINEFFSSLPGDLRGKPFVLRSTVPIGTTRGLVAKYNLLNICHSPEFLTARCAATDSMVPARNIIGINYNGDVYCLLYDLYKKRFPGVGTHLMTSEESEAVKLFTNAFFAVKVAFFNEINLISTTLGLDWDNIIKGMLGDGRISHNHTKVPGPDGKYGFGGDCLPKDLNGLIACAMDKEVYPFVCIAAAHRNSKDRARKMEDE